tara:strand:+ start:4518 stop:5513 length:996 start_codon:yes stop_codon:yes gene_type:complete
MEFFNQKEEVLELQLTEYGKYLLSQGALDPSYYAFFDDDILYNDQYADASGSAAGIRGEVQNKTDQRIRFETPNLKVMANRSGAQTRVDEFLSNVTASSWQVDSDPANKVDNFAMQQPFEDVTNIAAFPLGTSLLTSQYDAAWSVNLLNNNETVIASSKGYIVTTLTSSYVTGTLNGIITEIPQVDIDLDYQTYFAPPGDEREISTALPTGSSGQSPAVLALVKNYLVLDILEKNTAFEKENFDIEVYHISSDDILTQLNFIPESPEILSPNSLESGEVANVEYYMNIHSDENIPAEILNTVGLNQHAVRSNSDRLNIVRDLYNTIDEEPC